MFVLRTTREVVASRLGEPVDQVVLESPLGAEAPAVLSELYGRMVEGLLEEQVIASAEMAAGAEPGPEELAAADVVSVSDLVTRAAVRLLISSRLDVPPSELRPELSFALDLGADSLTRVDLVLLLEETLEVSVPDDSMFLVQTVGDAELFSVLFDRIREGVVIVLGERARDVTFDTPLGSYGEGASRVALDVAGRALGQGISLPDCSCRTLKDAVRLAFLTEKLRRALALAAGVEESAITGGTVPERDLGLDEARTRTVLAELTSSMDLGASSLEGSHGRALVDTVELLARVSAEETGGTPR